jgi:hypothetical protein
MRGLSEGDKVSCIILCARGLGLGCIRVNYVFAKKPGRAMARFSPNRAPPVNYDAGTIDTFDLNYREIIVDFSLEELALSNLGKN